MKFQMNFFACLIFLVLAACSNYPPLAEPPATTTVPPTTVPTETSLPIPTIPTETPLPPSPSPTSTESPPLHPGPRAMADMVFHEILGMVVMLNGSREDNPLWGWDGAQWQIVAERGPNRRSLGGMVYDLARRKLVVYGGYSLTSNRCQYDTWEWDREGWQELDVPGPKVCSHFVMEYDPDLRKVILFGGADDRQNPHPGIWTWDGQQWEILEVETPEVRFHAMSAFDTVHHSLFLLGGFDVNFQIFDEFWTWDGTIWEQPDIPRPTALSHAQMAFDSNREQVVLFGGSTRARIPLDLQDDTWILTKDAWERVSGPAPSPRGGQAMAYDPVRDQVVLYGGFNEADEELADTWAWRGLGWTCVDGCELEEETPAFHFSAIGQYAYVGNGDGYFWAVSDVVLWEYAAMGTLLATPVLGDGVLYLILSNDVVALR